MPEGKNQSEVVPSTDRSSCRRIVPLGKRAGGRERAGGKRAEHAMACTCVSQRVFLLTSEGEIGRVGNSI